MTSSAINSLPLYNPGLLPDVGNEHCGVSAELTRPTTITAIIPTFNRANYLCVALDSVLGQTRAPDQIIVLNDGSTDDTEQVVRAYGDAVQLISKANGGKANALNAALEHATGDWIWIFDDDDVAAPDALAMLADALEASPEAGFSYGLYTKFKGEHHDEAGQAVNDTSIDPGRLHVSLLEDNVIMQPGMLVRRSCYDMVGPFNPRFIRSQDYEMLLRLSRRFQACKVEKVVFHQRQHYGTRGTLADPINALNIAQHWMIYDRAIFTTIYQTHDLCEFLPEGQRVDLDDDRRITALIQRLCVMARKGLWELVHDDLRQVSDLAANSGRDRLHRAEKLMLRRIFVVGNLALGTVAKALPLHHGLRTIESPRLQKEMRAAMLWPFPYLFREALEHLSRAKFGVTLAAYRSIATPPTAILSLADRIGNRLVSLREEKRSAKHTA